MRSHALFGLVSTLDGEGHLYVNGVDADYNNESNVQKFRLPTWPGV